MSEIDELTGDALSEAVALARGWKKSRDAQQFSAWFWVDDAGVEQTAVAYYRPHGDIRKAWELEPEGSDWSWDFNEDQGGDSWLRYELWQGNVQVAFGLALISDFQTKAQAYATARCRAFLKAKAAE